MKELKEKIEAFENALAVNARTGDNKIFADVAQTSLIELQAKFIRGLESRVEILKRDLADTREVLEEMGGDVCQFCDSAMIRDEGLITHEGDLMCEDCNEKARNNI